MAQYTQNKLAFKPFYPVTCLLRNPFRSNLEFHQPSPQNLYIHPHFSLFNLKRNQVLPTLTPHNKMGYKRAVATLTGRRDSGLSFIPSLVWSTDEQVLLSRIEQTHVPDATHELEVRPLFLVVEHVIGRICHIVQSGAHEASWSEIEAGIVISHDVTSLIERLSCEMGCMCLGGAKTHDVTVSILESLANYTWEAKLVIALAAFSVSYGEFLQLSQAYSTNPLGQSMKPLKHLRSLVAQSEAFKTQFAVINQLVSAILDVTRLVVEFSEYPSELRNQQEPVAVYWAIESAVAASTLINLIATHGDEYVPPRELEPSKFLKNINFVRYNLEKFKEHVMLKLDFSTSGENSEPTLPSNPGTDEDMHNHDTTPAEGQTQTTLDQNNGGSNEAQGDGVNVDAKETRTFRFEVVEFVKEVLRPTWKKGQMSKKVYKAIVRKVVDQVYDSIQTDHIPQTQEKIHQYLSSSKPKLNKLVQEAYLAKIVEEQTNTQEKREEETYQMIRKTVFNMVHPDNLAVLKALIYSKDDILPLYHGSQRKRVSLNELEGKTVLLLVTGLDITSNELKALKKIYMESKTHTYNIIWIPIVNTNDVQWQLKFDNALSTMPWYSVHHASVVSNATIKFIKGDLNFKGKPILVALDDKGAIESMNAFNMIWIWKNEAFPMNRAKREVLLKQQTWNLELLFNNNHRITDWVKEGKYIVVYGGDDIDWIQNFNKTAKEVTTSAKINLELIYVGKASKNEKVQKIIAFMEAHKLGHYLKDETDMWFFWTRLYSILQLKIQMGKDDEKTDIVTQEIKKLVSYDTDVGAWAILAKGSEILHSGEGTAFLEVFSEHEMWIKEADEKFSKTDEPEHQCRLESKKLSEKMRCPECEKTLNIKIILSCL